MRHAMHSYRDYDAKDILLEGDLDEIVSHKVLQALKICQPATGLECNSLHDKLLLQHGMDQR